MVQDRVVGLGWFSKGDMIDEFWDATLKLKPKRIYKRACKIDVLVTISYFR